MHLAAHEKRLVGIEAGLIHVLGSIISTWFIHIYRSFIYIFKSYRIHVSYEVFVCVFVCVCVCVREREREREKWIEGRKEG